jgi:hypothetical protein
MKLQRIKIVIVVIDNEDAGRSSYRAIAGHLAVPVMPRWGV